MPASDMGVAGQAASSECTEPVALAPAPCPEGYWLNDDTGGGFRPDGTYVSFDKGDHLCHQQCESDADCSDPCLPHCYTKGLFQGGDFGCNGSVRICGAAAFDGCF